MLTDTSPLRSVDELFSCRIPTVQFDDRPVISPIGRAYGGQILISNRAGIADCAFRPQDRRAAVLLEPNVRQQPRPSTIAIEKGMDGHGEVMQPRRLFDQLHAGMVPPVPEVIEEALKRHKNLVLRRARSE